MMNFKIKKNWKREGHQYFTQKLQKELFKTKICIVVQSASKTLARSKMNALFNNYRTFKNYPLNNISLKSYPNIGSVISSQKKVSLKAKSYNMSSEELASFFGFPDDPKTETSLLKVTSRKLPLPIGIPTLESNTIQDIPSSLNTVGISDFRSIKVPIAIHDEDRLRHSYVVGKT